MKKISPLPLFFKDGAQVKFYICRKSQKREWSISQLWRWWGNPEVLRMEKRTLWSEFPESSTLPGRYLVNGTLRWKVTQYIKHTGAALARGLMLRTLRDQRMLYSDLECSPKFIHRKLSPQPGTIEVCGWLSSESEGARCAVGACSRLAEGQGWWPQRKNKDKNENNSWFWAAYEWHRFRLLWVTCTSGEEVTWTFFVSHRTTESQKSVHEFTGCFARTFCRALDSRVRY